MTYSKHIDISAYINWIEHTFNELIRNDSYEIIEKIILELPMSLTFQNNLQRRNGDFFEKAYIRKINLINGSVLTVNSNKNTYGKLRVINKIKEIIKQEM